MNRRDFLKTIGLYTAGISLTRARPLSAMASPNKSNRKPNIVFVLIDDMGFSDITCYGNKFIETPNIDNLARQGMLFTDAYAACPVCSPTRASILAGQYPARIGLTDFIPGHQRPWEKLKVPLNRQQYLPLELVTFIEALKPAGYVAGGCGKWHLGRGDNYRGEKYGFDTYFTIGAKQDTAGDKRIGVLTDFSIDFIEQNKDKPFVLYLSHYAVHVPLKAPEKLIEKYKNKPKPPTGVNNPIYAAMIEHLDTGIGRILRKLDELNLSDNTVVIFFSDNGGLYKLYTGGGAAVTTNAPLRDEKATLYEGGIRVPLIVRWPGVVKPGSKCNVPVTSVDWYPTFLEIAGAKPVQNQVLDGKSIIPLLKQTDMFKRDAIFWHYPHYHHSTPAGAVRAGEWKLIEFYDDGRLELYNLKDDIAEAHNLAKKMPQKAKQLQQTLAAWRKSVKADMPTPNPDYDPARAHEWGPQKWK